MLNTYLYVRRLFIYRGVTSFWERIKERISNEQKLNTSTRFKSFPTISALDINTKLNEGIMGILQFRYV